MPNACEALYIRVQCFTMSFVHLLYVRTKLISAWNHRHPWRF
ncbi:hypothetical protein HMPREF9554_00897 [Treponema phagedenis F0421]|nr:hypothetical protein HMPREF9554_00897 [Treponema phagedenis F0421]